MAYAANQLENRFKNKHRSGLGKAFKRARNRKIRRTPIEKAPNLKYDGWVV